MEISFFACWHIMHFNCFHSSQRQCTCKHALKSCMFQKNSPLCHPMVLLVVPEKKKAGLVLSGPKVPLHDSPCSHSFAYLAELMSTNASQYQPSGLEEELPDCCKRKRGQHHVVSLHSKGTIQKELGGLEGRQRYAMTTTSDKDASKLFENCFELERIIK